MKKTLSIVLMLSSAALVAPCTLFASDALAKGARASPALVAQAPPQTTRTIEIEITDADKGAAARVLKLGVSVETGGTWSRMTTHAGSEVYRVGVRIENDRLWLELNRSDGNGVVPEVNLNTCITLALGKRAIISRVQRASGSITEVALVAK